MNQRTCPYFVLERKHKHLLQVAKALMFHSTLPAHFWSESIISTTYLINRMPRIVLSWKTPYEILFQRKPSYNHLKIFGCICFAINTKPGKHKFEQRALKCIFIGYASGYKAYKLYDLENKTLIVSTD